MIEIKHVYKRYHTHRATEWVLHDVNLTIPSGVSVGLVGGNGAGKSTLLRLIAGMDSPTRGEIKRHSSVSWPIGLAGGFQGSMTGRQNVKFVARVHGGHGNEAEIIRRVESFAEIGPAFDQPVKTYSSGMRSRLNFGLSLAFDFDIYLSDEATSVGDRAFQAKASKAFKDKVGKASLIMVSHGVGILRELCQAGIYLRDGHAHWYDDINDAIEAYHSDSDAHVLERKLHQLANSKTTSLKQAQILHQEAKAHFDSLQIALEQLPQDIQPRERQASVQAVNEARETLHGARRLVQKLK
ncbi:ABC transporter ATP-binding protein [Cobetia amphilecti]|uniref:ABC transporter ATP-binding protein n=1 Tax=Cobetia amphilecti TaxID=1055104 RepID=A0AAP4TV05_9GAMM|nr:ABC transporter ATP-binding protein [Cobetia amphilecti]MDO6670862.1 ABC transporter ATP-binding protein [Cobetia amphilecti]